VLRGTYESGPWRVDTWERPREPGVASRDAILVDPRPDRLRIVAIDGVTPTFATPAVAGIDSAIWAASIVRSTLLAHLPLEACAHAANAALRASGPVESPRDRPQAAFVAADLMGEGVELLRAGDCEAWVQHNEHWERVFPREIDTAAERARMEQWTTAHPDRPYLEYDRARPEAYDIWTTSALGRLPRPILQVQTLVRCARLVVATDGARLNEGALVALGDWLDRIDEHQQDNPVSRWEAGPDDMAVVSAWRRS